MSTINPNRRELIRQQSTEPKANSNLSEIAKTLNIAQPGDVNEEDDKDAVVGSGRAKGGKAGRAGHAGHAGMVGASEAGLGFGAKVGAAPSALPDSSESAAEAPAAGDVEQVGALATSDDAGAALGKAIDKLAADMADPNVTQAALAQDISDVKTQMAAAGAPERTGQIVRDLADADGSGTPLTGKVKRAAKDAGVDLIADDTNAAAAAKQLDATVAATPANAGLVQADTLHVVRTNLAEGEDPTPVLQKSAAKAKDAGASSGLAALYATAAKNGVDLSHDSEDDIGKVKSAATEKAGKRKQQNAQRYEAPKPEYKGTGSATNNGGGAGKPAESSASEWNGSTYGAGASKPIPNDDGSLEAYIAANPACQPFVEMAKQAGASTTPQIPARVLLGQLNAESSFNPNAQGARGEIGIAQFTSETWASGGYAGSPSNPADAILAQAQYDAKLANYQNGDVQLGLMMYNGWTSSRSFGDNTAVGCSPTYIQDITGQAFDQGEALTRMKPGYPG